MTRRLLSVAMLALCSLALPPPAAAQPNLELDLAVARIAWPEPVGFVEEEQWPDVTVYNFWRRWYELHIEGQVPLGHRTFCSVDCPEYSADLELARETADNLSVSYGPNDDAEDISNAIVAAASGP